MTSRHRPPSGTHDGPEKTVVLGPGDFHFGHGRTRISTLLGSCVSLILWHPRKKIGGMCHYMLSERQRPADTPLDGRFAAEAFELFLHHVAIAATRPSDYEAKLFGGASMFAYEDKAPLLTTDIGQINIDYGHALLKHHNIPLVAEHVGGNGRRNLHFDIWTGDAWLAFPEGEGAAIKNTGGKHHD